MTLDRVTDDEGLYRSVRSAEIIRDAAGRPLRASSQAFMDRQQEVSVDRARLCDHDPSRSQRSDTDAVVQLIAAEVRGIRTLMRRDEQSHEVGFYAIDVRPAPLPHQPAHALIFADPQFATRSLFKRLQERLAQMARFVLVPEPEA